MRINLVCPPLNPSGGLRVIAIYASWLRQRGHEVTVVAPSHPARSRWADRSRRWLNWAPADRGQPPRGHYFESFIGDIRILPSYRPIKSSDLPDADVLVSTWWETTEWARDFGPRKGVHVHFVQHHEVFENLPLPRVEAVYRLPTKKVVVARWLAEVMRDRYGDSNTVVVPNAIDHALFHAPARPRQSVPTVGTLFHETPFKGLDVALSVLRTLHAEFSDLRVVMFGSHGPSDSMRSKLDGIDLHIAPPQNQLRALYAMCDVWLSCSRSEGFNLTAMEAMACRTPVVSTRTGWPEEAIESGRNGYLAPVDDVASLAESCGRILRMEEQDWSALSEAAYATVAAASWDRSARQFEVALQAAADRRW